MVNFFYPQRPLVLIVGFVGTLTLSVFLQMCVPIVIAQEETLGDADRFTKEVLSLYAQGKFNEAIPIAEKVVEIRKRLGGDRDYAQSLSNLASLYESTNQYDRAEGLYEQALEIEKAAGTNDPEYAAVLNNLAVLHKSRGRYAKAEPLLKEALGIEKAAGEDDSEYAASLNNLAMLYKSMGQYKESQVLLRQALKIDKASLGENDPAYATDLNNLGVVYRLAGKYAKAETVFKQALHIQRSVLGTSHVGYAKSLNNLAQLYDSTGQYERSEHLYEQALDIKRRALGETHPDYATGLSNLAMLYESIGRYDKAQPLLERALEIDKAALGDNHPAYATDLNNIAVVHESIGQYDKSESLFKQALEIDKAVLGENHPEYATGLNNLAALYKSIGRYDEAQALLEQALLIDKGSLGESHPQYARDLDNLASVYQSRGQYDKVEGLVKQALDIQGKLLGENHPDYAHSLTKLAMLYESTGQSDKSELLLKQALKIRQQRLGKGHPDYARGLNNLAALYDSKGQYDRAEPLYRQALEIQKTALGENHPDYAITLLNLAFLYQMTGKKQKSLSFIDHAMQVEQRNLDAVFEFSAEPAMRAYLESIGFSQEVLVSMAIEEESRDSLPSINVAVRQAAARWILQRKAMVFDALARFQQAERLQEHDPDVAQKMVRLRELEQRLHTLALNPPKDMKLAVLQQERKAAKAELERIEAELNRRLSRQSLSQREEEIGVGTVQQHLPVDAVVLEFLRANIFDFKEKSWQSMRYFALVIRGGGEALLRLIDLGEAEEIDRRVKNVREQITDFAKLPETAWIAQEKPEEESFQKASGELYHAIFKPALKEAVDGVKTLYVAPDGELNQIAFESLVDETGKYLIESSRFVYLTAGRDLLRRFGESGKETVVFAAPDYNLAVKEREGQAKALVARLEPEMAPRMHRVRLRDIRGLQWGPLKGAAQEAADIHELLDQSQFGPVEDYQGPRALEEVFLALRSPRILHVATHGYFLPDQEIPPEDLENLNESPEYGVARGLARLRGTEDPLLRSGLVFAGANLVGSPQADADKVGDGWVTAEEVSLMDLRGTELVVLSACESGLGDVRTGDGVQGLRRAFLLAGARSLIMSLYKVPDDDSRQLMRRFYGRLKDGRSKLSALHEAQLEMIQERRKAHGAAHPFFWGSFVLLGEPN